MAYTTPGTSKLSLGVDTSAGGLKSDVKKNIQSEVDKARHAKLTKQAGGYTDVNVIPKERSQETKDAYNTQIKKVATDTRENQHMLQTTKDMDAGKLKNIKRGKYTENVYDSNKTKYGDSRDTITPRDASGNITKFGKYTKGNFTKHQTSPENRDNYDTAVSGTSTTQKGIKGSSEAYTFEQDMPDAKPEFESRASKRSDLGPRYGGGQQKSPWANKTAGGMRSGVEAGSHQGVEQQKTMGEISKRKHSKLQAKNVLGAGPGSNRYSGYTSQGLGIVDKTKKAPTNKEVRQKARDIRKTGRATDRRIKSDAKAKAAQKAGDARLGLDLSSASKRDPSKTDSARKKVNDLSLLSQNKINKNIV